MIQGKEYMYDKNGKMKDEYANFAYRDLPKPIGDITVLEIIIVIIISAIIISLF